MAAFTFCSFPLTCVLQPTCEPKPCSLASISRRASAVPRGGIVRCSTESSKSLDAGATTVQEPKTTYQFPPTVWDGYGFSSSPTDNQEKLEARRQELKNEVKSMLSLAAHDPFQQLDLIDKIQRLGVAYHFQHDIKHILETIYNDGTHFLHCTDLYLTSIWFRLLRQAGHYTSADVFNQFRDDKGQFHANLASDALGMLSLYQASYLGITGEDIMDEAMAFTTKQLHLMLPHLSPPLALQVKHALKLPLRKSVQRIDARHFISFYQKDESRKETLLEFAKLDFNALQRLHRNEITILSTWWKGLNMKSRLPYPVRDRVVEAYIIMSSLFFEPQFSLSRIHLTKLWLIATLIDDAHELYGNLHQLQLFCEAIQRWDDVHTSGLTGPLKQVFLETISFVKDVEREMNERGHFIGIPYVKKGLQDFVKAQFEEAKYLFLEDLPTLEKWFSIATNSTGMKVFVQTQVMHMGLLATKEVFDWIASGCKPLTYIKYVTRILDDIATFKREQDTGINISTVTCYSKQHGVPEPKAVENLRNMLPDLWKSMNHECLRSNFIPMSILNIILNFSRAAEEFYGDGQDGFTTSKGRTEDTIMSLIVDPIYT